MEERKRVVLSKAGIAGINNPYPEISINIADTWVGLNYNKKRARWEMSAEVHGVTLDDDDWASSRLDISMGVAQAVSNCLHHVSIKKAKRLGKELEAAAALVREWVDWEPDEGI